MIKPEAGRQVTRELAERALVCGVESDLFGSISTLEQWTTTRQVYTHEYMWPRCWSFYTGAIRLLNRWATIMFNFVKIDVSIVGS